MSRTTEELWDEFLKKPLVYAQEPARVSIEVEYWRGGVVRLGFKNVNLHAHHIPEAEQIRDQYVGRPQTHTILAQMEAEFNHWLEGLVARGEIYWNAFVGKWQ